MNSELVSPQPSDIPETPGADGPVETELEAARPRSQATPVRLRSLRKAELQSQLQDEIDRLIARVENQPTTKRPPSRPKRSSGFSSRTRRASNLRC